MDGRGAEKGRREAVAAPAFEESPMKEPKSIIRCPGCGGWTTLHKLAERPCPTCEYQKTRSGPTL